MKHLKCLIYLLRHKWFVLVAGHSLGVPLWRLVIHDWSKFLPSEWFPYADEFHGSWRTRAEKWSSDDLIHRRFDVAWLHHIHFNPHHWQHWVLREDDGGTKVLAMPIHFADEMVADWMGAGRAITGKWRAGQWYLDNCHHIKLHPLTELRVRSILFGVGGI